MPHVTRNRGDPRQGAEGSAHRVRGRALHPRQLSDRGRTVATYAHTKAMMHGDSATWRRLLDAPGRHRRCQRCAPKWKRGRRRCSCSTAGPARSRPTTTSATCCRRRPRSSRASPTSTSPASTSAWRTGELLGLMGDAGADVVGVDWRVPLDVGRASGRGGQGGAGQPRPRSAAWPRGTSVEAGVRDVLRRNAGRPGHVFNLGHGVLPETDPDMLRRVVDLVHAGRQRRDDDRRAADGLRHAGHARRRRGVLHPHPPRPDARARAARRPAPPLRRHRRHVAAARDHPRARRRACRRPWATASASSWA